MHSLCVWQRTDLCDQQCSESNRDGGKLTRASCLAKHLVQELEAFVIPLKGKDLPTAITSLAA